MSFTPPVTNAGFAYANDGFFAEASNQNRHRRATVSELQALFHPPARKPSTTDKDPVGHWYEAQLLHYGLPQSKSKAVAKTRLLEAVNKGGLAVPAHIQKIEIELKKEWLKRDRAAKKQGQSPRASTTETAAKKSTSLATADESSARKGKKRKTEEGDATNKASKRTVKHANASAKAQEAQSGSSTAHLTTKRTATAIYSGPPRGGPSMRGRASATSGRSRGSGSTRDKGGVGDTSRAISSSRARPTRQMARRAGGVLQGRGSFTPGTQHGLFSNENFENDAGRDYSQSFFDSPDTASALCEDGYGDPDREASTDSNEMDCKEENVSGSASELPPLGLVNGRYHVESEDLDEWEEFDGHDLSLILCLDGSAVWGAYDFGMFSGIMHLTDRPWSSSHDHVPFSWRGRENGENTISFGPNNKSWIRFLGGGAIEGMINCYGEALFKGQRSSGNETRAPRDARSMRTEWEGYNFDEYERESRARWGGSGW